MSDVPAGPPEGGPEHQQVPGQQAGGAPPPQPPYWGQPVPSPWGAPPPPPARASVPGWTWPLVAVLALVLGLVGGAIGAGLVKGDEPTGDTPGGVLKVQTRTAPPLPADNRSIAAVAAKMLPSTVHILAEYDGEARGAAGSGFVLDRDGHVITNNHVVADAAKDNGPIEVIDHSGRHHKATIVGRSVVYDLAVLKVGGGSRLRPAALGAARQMRVGETVVAFGSPLGLSATVTSGIISAMNRPVSTGDGKDSSYINAVQTDAAINPGNSGGPLVNLQGQVIGVDSAIASLGGSSSGQDESGNIGVGFAIPIEQVLVTTDQILKTGEARYPVIGADVRGTGAMDGARVIGVASGSPAAKAHLRVGDVITAVDGTPITGSIDVVVAIRTHQPGEHVILTVRNSGKVRKVSVGLAGKVG